ncbi:hypothetical protein ACEWY4_018806 [Coilia grayii]|uniref:Ig-like domain-containing protein n=1 Tax=Coilia grayii TaxID=363190 RepID=A0ABD1JFI9_9TELE
MPSLKRCLIVSFYVDTRQFIYLEEYLYQYYDIDIVFLGVGDDKYSLTLPEKIETLAGSCVLIPCNFTVPENCKINSSGSIRGMWIRGGKKVENLVFDSTHSTTIGFERIEIRGNLHQQNCTTIFYNVESNHTNNYYFRVETPAFKYTFFQFLNLMVKVSPQVSGPSEVAEGTSVNLTCTAAAPCPDRPPNITWSLHTGDITTHIQDEGDCRRNLTFFLTFTASHSHHGREIYCTVSYITQKQKTVEKNSTVHLLEVQFSPEVVEASVSPSGAVAEGSSVALTCNSSEANPPVHNYTWFRDTQTSPVGSGPNITFNVSSSHAGLYYCRAEHPQGGEESNKVELKVEGLSFKRPNLFSLQQKVKTLIKVDMAQTNNVLDIFNLFELQHSAGRGKDGSAHTNASNPTKDQQEKIHYGEINFSRPPLRDRSEGTGQQGLGQAPESEYAKVLLPGRDGQARYQKAPDTQDLYAQVKRK